MIQNTTKRKASDIAGGTLTITDTNHRFVTCSDDSTSPGKTQGDFIVTMSFLNGHSTDNRMFTLSVRHLDGARMTAALS